MTEECIICKAPLIYLEKDEMMEQPFCHMHRPEHHVMVGSALLAAYKNAGGEIDLPEALLEMMNRGKAVPGGVCGFWGACGAGISTGMFISIISAIDYVEENFNIQMEKPVIKCIHSDKNNQCIKERCPFHE